MAYEIEYAKPAAKELGKLPRETARRIREAVDPLAEDPLASSSVTLERVPEKELRGGG